MKRTDNSEMNEGNAFYMIVWLGMLIAFYVFLFCIEWVINMVKR
jgi:hypothetical protein